MRPDWAPAQPYETWAWVELDDDGREGVIAAVIPGLGFMGPAVLQSRFLARAESLEPLARQHARASRHKVRLVHLSEVAW